MISVWENVKSLRYSNVVLSVARIFQTKNWSKSHIYFQSWSLVSVIPISIFRLSYKNR